MVDIQSAVSIVVVTWNAKKLALACLESLSGRQDSIASEIIAVDNASTDGTPEAISAGFPEVRLVRNQSNLGFAKANNIGIALSRGKYICLVNSDVVVPSDCLALMLSYMDQHPDIGMLGPKMILPGGSVGQSCMRFPGVWNWFCGAVGLDSLFKGCRALGDFMMAGFSYDQTIDVDVLTGWFWLVRREAVEQIGVLDERFFMYGEDIDWSKRFRLGGWRVVFYSEAEAIHHCGASSSRAPVRFYIEMNRANIQYFEKHHGALALFGFKLAVWLHQILRMIGYGIKYLLAPSRCPECRFKVRRSAACLMWLMGFRHLEPTQRSEQNTSGPSSNAVNRPLDVF